MPMRDYDRNRGFTLVEAVIVIVLTGVIGAIVAVFIRAPVEAYFATARRAELTDIADTAVRRMARDIQAALPNSVRVDTTSSFLEFLPIKTAGRYRAAVTDTGTGNPLDFGMSTPDSSFDVLGPNVDVQNGDQIVIYNLGIPGADGSDAYEGTSRRAAVAPFGSVSSISFSPAGTEFPFASPGSRFQVISTPVSYVCQPDSSNPANGVLYRYSGYAIQASQPVTVAALDGYANRVKATLATNVSACWMTYTTVAQQHLGLVSIYLALTKGGETVQLRYQVNVDNTP